jgi:small subunit ribosomal protein S20
MPHIPFHPSAAKRHRQNLKRRERNRAVKTRVRTAVKQALEAMDGDDRAAAETKLREAVRVLSQARSAGTLARNTVSRKVARLSTRLHRAYAAKAAEPPQP